MKTRSLFLASASVLLFATSAAAQSFNIDIGNQVSPYLIPSSAYGAGASQPGTWVNGGTTSPAGPFNDINNAVTTVTLTHGLDGAVSANTYALTGDDQNLMCDILDTVTGSTYVFSPLAAGDYTVYTYAWAPDLNTAITSVNGIGSVEGTLNCGGPWTGGAHVQGTTYVVHHFNGVPAGGSISFTFGVVTSFDSVNGFQIVHTPIGPPATAYCFGDGTGTACPCGNVGAAGNGCASSVNAAGGNLAATGVASIGGDTFSLNGSGMPNASALYFQGTTQVGAGAGAPFGDGLRCAGGTIIRLGTKTNASGASSYPGGSTAISIKGNNVAGNVRNYQCWYRNAAAFCTVDTFNLTNALNVTWAP